MGRQFWVIAVQLKATTRNKRLAATRSPRHKRKKPIYVARCVSDPKEADKQGMEECMESTKIPKRAKRFRLDVAYYGPLEDVQAYEKQRRVVGELRGRGYLIYNETAKRDKSVYVVELREEVRQAIKKALRGDDDKPCVSMWG